MSRIVALSLAYALSGATVPSATNASFGRYTEEQLTAWWDANVAAPRPDCGACAARNKDELGVLGILGASGKK